MPEQTSPIPAVPDTPHRLVLVRHGRTEWAHAGRHTGTTDVPLDEVGERQARSLSELLAGFDFVKVFSSPLSRARRTAKLAGIKVDEIDPDLREWDYGGYEGKTSAEIREIAGPNWAMFRDGPIPGATPGESLAQVGQRAAGVVARMRPLLSEGDVAVFAHGHLLRILTSQYLGLAPDFAAQIELDPASVSILGVRYAAPTIVSWNHRRPDPTAATGPA